MRKTAICLVLLVCACSGPAPVEEAPPADKKPEGPPPWMLTAAEQPRGLIKKDPAASPGYVMFAPFSSDTAYLVDVDGEVVHTWKNEKSGDSFHLQNDGSYYRLARIPQPSNFRAGGVSGYAQRIGWDSEVLWDWKMGDEKRMLHHDIMPLPNGNILAIAWEQKTPEEAQAAGRRVDLIPQQGLWSEWILEIQPLPPNDARIVWEWHVWDHLVASEDAAKFPRRLDVNGDGDAEKIIDPKELEQLKALGYVPDNATEEDLLSDFLHMNAIDYHPRLDQIAVSLPNIGEIWILDHSTTTEEAKGSEGGRYGHGGDLLYRWGNPRVYGRGQKSEQQLFGQHNVLWIADGWKNAGNLTIFNNGGDRAWSSVVEIAPPLEESGQYTLEEGKPFGPAAPVWTYQAPDKHSFYAPFVSGANRLANGHTFICAGTHGRYFEVTPEGSVVWEYRSPFHGEVAEWNPPGVENFPYASFRAIKFPPDHPAFRGRTLAPLDPQPPGYVPPPRAPKAGS